MKNDKNQTHSSRPPVRPVTKQLYQALVLDTWPSPAAVVDFGIDSERHYAALQHAIIQHDVTVEELDDAACDGPSLTALIRAESPYHGLTFTTSWDDLCERSPRLSTRRPWRQGPSSQPAALSRHPEPLRHCRKPTSRRRSDATWRATGETWVIRTAQKTRLPSGTVTGFSRPTGRVAVKSSGC